MELLKKTSISWAGLCQITVLKSSPLRQEDPLPLLGIPLKKVLDYPVKLPGNSLK